MLRADDGWTAVDEAASPSMPAAGSVWRVDIDWLEPDIALLYACADLRRFLLQVGQGRITGGARLRIAQQPAVTVLFWCGTPAELAGRGPAAHAPLLPVGDGVVGCDSHGVVLLCTAKTHLLGLVRGQRTTLEIPGVAPSGTDDPRRALPSCLHALLAVNLWRPPADMRSGFGRRILRECLSARIRQLIAAPAVATRVPLLVKLLLSRAALEDLSGTFAACAERALETAGTIDAAGDHHA